MTVTELDSLAGIIASTIKDATEPLLARLADLEQRLATVKDGTDGRDGKDGVNGADGKDGVGQVGPQGQPGEKGTDGIGLADATLDLEGRIVLIRSDGTTKLLGPVVGRDGAVGATGATGAAGVDGSNGTNGRDGTLEHLKMVRMDERTVAFCFKDGTPVEGGTVTLNHPVFRGPYSESAVYKEGDLTQYASSTWIAVKDAPAMKPGTGAPHVTGWNLFSKRGGDGKTGAKGDVGDRGAMGPQGPPGPARY